MLFCTPCAPVALRRAVLLIACFTVLLAAMPPSEALHIGEFSSGTVENGLPAGWDKLRFTESDKTTIYTLVREDGTIVLRAESDGGAGGLVTERRVDPNAYPIIEWRWKVDNVLDKGDATTKSGDDYPARVYVLFDTDESRLSFGERLKLKALKTFGYDNIPTRCISYIWANTVDTGTFIPSPYTDWVQMMPLQSGAENAGTWQQERRNILDDYRAAFDEEPPPIRAIAVMTDTDNTGESAVAYYGDIVLKAADTPSASAP